MPVKQLRDDQIEDLAFYMCNDRCANLSDPGTGKTGSVCVYAEYLWNEKKVKSIWAMPKSLLMKNYYEMLDFTDMKPDEVVVVDGTPAQREAQMKNPNGKVFLMGFKRWADDWKTVLKYHPQTTALLLDEFHMGGFKNPRSKRNDSLYECMRRFKYFLPMSGTLIDGRLDSAYSAIHVIEPRYYPTHFAFLAQHALIDDYGNPYAWINHKKITKIFSKHCVRRTFDSIHGKQEVLFFHEGVEMDAKSRKAYSQLEAFALLELSDKFIQADNPAVESLRCRQIMQHPHSMGILKEEEFTGKEEALMVHLEDHANNKEPLLIFSVLEPEQTRLVEICKGYGFRVGLINGTVPAKKRAEIDEMFRKGQLDILVCSPETASVGYNWQHVNHIIFVSMDYKNVNFVQAFSRAVRSARQHKLRVTILEYRNSIDKRIFEIVDNKSKDLAKVDPTYQRLYLSKPHFYS